MTNNLSFCYHSDKKTKELELGLRLGLALGLGLGLGLALGLCLVLGSAQVEVLRLESQII